MFEALPYRVRRALELSERYRRHPPKPPPHTVEPLRGLRDRGVALGVIHRGGWSKVLIAPLKCFRLAERWGYRVEVLLTGRTAREVKAGLLRLNMPYCI